MRLTLQSRTVGDVVVVRCQGRIISGDEVRSLQLELERLTQVRKKVVLQLAEVSHIDSSGLGALVRHFGMLQNAGGDLKLCELSPFALRVLQVTNLLSLFHTHASETEAIEAFSERPRHSEKASTGRKTRVVCIDTSSDLLAYLNALLTRSGYELFTTRYPSDAMTLVSATRPCIVIYGPGMPANEQAIEKFRQSAPNAQIVVLPPDFSTAEAGQAGIDLVNRIRSLLGSQQ
jgi:anti-anti-sigma factor